jgi:hypothetical protein
MSPRVVARLAVVVVALVALGMGAARHSGSTALSDVSTPDRLHGTASVDLRSAAADLPVLDGSDQEEAELPSDARGVGDVPSSGLGAHSSPERVRPLLPDRPPRSVHLI